MSGIFKGVKKTIKKVGKVIKKIAPVLILAAGVYFGGAYLMGSGAATAGAAGSVGTSFTKAAGVWKSFIGGLGNGTASQSAAAFAEASYQASVGANPLSLSGQVAAGTAAVNALSTMGSTADAVSAGLELARSSWGATGGDPQGSWNILLNGLNKSQQAVQAQAAQSVAQSAQVATSQPTHSTGYLHDAQTAEEAIQLESGLLGGGGEESAVGDGSPADISLAAAKQHGSEPLHTPAGAQTALDQSGGIVPPPPPTTVQSGTRSAAQSFAETNKGILELMQQQQVDSRAASERLAESRERIAKQQMYMQGAGLLLSAYGASEKTMEEKKYDAMKKWKPTGTERLTHSGGLIHRGTA